LRGLTVNPPGSSCRTWRIRSVRSATSIQVPYASPTIATPVAYRQSATDADNQVRTTVAATYLQDQLELSPRLQAIGGIRFDRFDLAFHNNRNGDTLSRRDDLLSPRAALVYKPITPVSASVCT